MLFQKVNKLVYNFLALAGCENINEISYRLGVANARTACTYNRRQIGSVLTANGQACQIKHIEHIGIAHLILHGKAYHIEVFDTVAAFKSVKRNIVFTHKLFHIFPRCKNPLAPCFFTGIYERVKDFHTEVRHTDFIVVGKTESIPEFHLVLIFNNAVKLAACISCRFLNIFQKFFQFFRKHTLPLSV